MIEEISIQNFALIDRLTIRFSLGMTALSGETGAGKSILAGALGLLHGERAEVESIRSGCQEAVVSGVFRCSETGPVADWLKERDIELEEGQLFLRRTIKRTGRGSIYIQSVPMPLKELAELGSLLFDMHGQHEHQSLFQEENHRKILDSFGRLDERVAEYHTDFLDLTRLRKKRSSIVSDDQARQREADMLNFALKEIEAAKLRPNEDDELQAERSTLTQYERLYSSLDTAYAGVAESRGGALAQLRTARAALDAAAGIDPQLADYSKRLEEAFFEIEDIAEGIGDYHRGLLFDPKRLEVIEDRLAEIRRLQKKYGASLTDVLQYAEDARETLDALEHSEEELEKLDAELRDRERNLLQAARQLSEQRREYAGVLSSRIQETLATLGMPKVEFEIRVDAKTSENGKPVCGPFGQDSVVFRISANPGEPTKPLASVASGGEVSRIMLSIKSVLAETDPIETLIFDEIDTGIGGEVALSVGQHLQKLSTMKQIFCITHLASVAVRADNQLVVLKEQKEDRTVTRVNEIDESQRVEEIARMLAGDRNAEVSRSHAEELLRRYGSSRIA